MIKITETEEVVILQCTKCGEVKCVEVDSPKFAYREINKFRKVHLQKGHKSAKTEKILPPLSAAVTGSPNTDITSS